MASGTSGSGPSASSGPPSAVAIQAATNNTSWATRLKKNSNPITGPKMAAVFDVEPASGNSTINAYLRISNPTAAMIDPRNRALKVDRSSLPGSIVYTHMKINTSAAMAISSVTIVITGASHAWSPNPSNSRT